MMQHIMYVYSTAQAQRRTHVQESICRGVASDSLAIIYPAINWVNTSGQTGCHTPLISDYSSASKLRMSVM